MSWTHSRSDCFCAFCKTPRTVYLKRRVNVFNILASIFASLVITWVLWQEFDPRGIFVFVVCLAMGEAFVQIRWRLNIVCRHCGFDPILYLKDSAAAAQKVKDFLDQRKKDPAYILSRPLNIPRLTPEQAEAAKRAEFEMQSAKKKGSSGKILSKQI